MAVLVFADRRRRARLRLTVRVALAASVLIAALTGYFLFIAWHGGDAASIPLAKDAPGRTRGDESSVGITDSADGARRAVAALSERWAAETKEQTKVLLAAVNPMEIADISLPVAIERWELEPAAQSLQQAGQNVADGLAPVTASARQALRYLYRDLPSLETNP